MLDLTLSGQGFATTLVPIAASPIRRVSTTRTRQTTRKPRGSGKLIIRKKLGKKTQADNKSKLKTSQSTPTLRTPQKSDATLPPITPVKKEQKVEPAAKSETKPKPKAAPIHPLKQAKRAWAESHRMEAVRSFITIRYSHYKSKFECRDGVVKWSDIDAEYSISFVFKGEFKRHILCNGERLGEAKEKGNLGADYFLGLKMTLPERDYVLEVEEGEEGVGIVGAKRVDKYVAADRDNGRERRKTRGEELITEELKGLSVDEVRQKGEKVKELLEAREREAILFGGG